MLQTNDTHLCHMHIKANTDLNGYFPDGFAALVFFSTCSEAAHPPETEPNQTFWATICKTVRPMLSDHCPVLSVCDIAVLGPNGWMDQNETWHAGRPRPGHIVLDCNPAPPKGHSPQSPPFPQIDIIRAVVIVWRVRGKTIRSVLCNIVCNNCAQCDAHIYEQTNSSLDWVLSHCAHFTVLDSFLYCVLLCVVCMIA